MNYVENERTGSGCSWGPDAARLGWDVPEMRSHSWGQVMLPLCELPQGLRTHRCPRDPRRGTRRTWEPARALNEAAGPSGRGQLGCGRRLPECLWSSVSLATGLD